MRRVIIVFVVFLVIGFIFGFLAACQEIPAEHPMPADAQLVSDCYNDTRDLYKAGDVYYLGSGPDRESTKLHPEASLSHVCQGD
jgi:hypothetical protein